MDWLVPGEIGDVKAVDPLIGALKNGIEWGREGAVKHFGASG